MENIYKIKIRTNPDPTGVYPSERRYSASTVLGLSVVHLALAITALLMATLTVTGYQLKNTHVTHVNETKTLDSTIEITLPQPEEGAIEDDNGTVRNVTMNVHPNLSVAPCVMSLGALTAGLTGLLAWKRWYIDHNIRWFFCTTVLSTITSSICVFVTTITIVTEYEKYLQFPKLDTLGTIDHFDYSKMPNIKFILSLNILVACALELLWSGLSAKVAFAGMRNTYPDDIIISKRRGKIEVNTVHKGNKKAPPAAVPPDILNHFPNSSKLAKYLPRIEEVGNLPKTESNSEYQERVRKFLSGNNHENEKNINISENGSDVHVEQLGDKVSCDKS